MNSEGMTWEEWLQASGQGLFDRYGVRPLVALYPLSLRKAFLNSEDPSEYRSK
jgi:hypothetical protein